MPANLHAEDLLVHNIQGQKGTRPLQEVCFPFEICGDDHIPAELLPERQREFRTNLSGCTNDQYFIQNKIYFAVVS